MIARSRTPHLAGALLALGFAVPAGAEAPAAPFETAQLVLPGAGPGLPAAATCITATTQVTCGANGTQTIRITGTVAAALANGQATVTTTSPGLAIAPMVVPIAGGGFVVDVVVTGGKPGQVVTIDIAGVGDVIPMGLNLPGGFDICCSASTITVVLPQCPMPPVPPPPPPPVVALPPPPPPPPPVSGPPVSGPTQPTLTLRKSGPATCPIGQTCTFEVTVLNSGPGTYSGPLAFQDQVANGRVVMGPTPDCVAAPPAAVGATTTCSRATAQLPPGGSLTFRLPLTTQGIPLANNVAQEAQNCAMLTAPVQGPPSCVPFTIPAPPAPPAVPPNLSITKTAPPSCVMGQPCTYQIVISNAGPGTYTGTLDLLDLQEQAFFAPLNVAGDPGWDCPLKPPPGTIDLTNAAGVTQPGMAGVNQFLAANGAAPVPLNATLPANRNACKRPNTTLRAGESLRLTATIDLSAPNVRLINTQQSGGLANCAMLMINPDGTPMVPFVRAEQTVSCATAPMPQPAQPVTPPAQPSLTLSKTGPATCAQGATCTFEVTVQNTGPAPFVGPLSFQDQLAGNGQIALAPTQGCMAATVPGVPAAANCGLPTATLVPGGSVTTRLPVTVPATAPPGQAQNCAMLMAPVQGPPSCVSFTIPAPQQAGPPVPPPTLLPPAPNAPPAPPIPRVAPPRDGGLVFPVCPAGTVPLPGPPGQCCPTGQFNAAEATCRGTAQTPPPGPQLRLVKRGPATCTQGERCAYQVFVQNQGPGTYTGTLAVTDWLPQGSPDDLRLDQTHPEAGDWVCGQPTGTTQLRGNVQTCLRRNTTLVAGDFVTLGLEIVSTQARTMVRNCAVVGDRQPQFIWRLPAPDRSFALRGLSPVDPAAFGVSPPAAPRPAGERLAQLRLPATQQPGSAPNITGLGPPPRGASCVDTFMEAAPTPAAMTVPPPVVPAVTRDPCPPGFALNGGRCQAVCAANQVWNGQACITRPPQCRQGQAFINGRCQDLRPTCAAGTRWDGRTCALIPCPTGQVRDDSGRCVTPPCPQGTVRDRQGRCVTVQQAPPSCPRGTEFDRRSGRCIAIETEQPRGCPQGFIRTSRGECIRPSGPPPQQQPNVVPQILQQLPGIIQQFTPPPRQQPQQPPVIQQQKPQQPPPVIQQPSRPPPKPPLEGCPPGYADVGRGCQQVR